MTIEDINDIINAICPNDEDYEKPCISPKYLRQELEQLALDQRQWNEEPTTKNDLGVDCINRNTVLTLINDVKNANGFSEYSQYEYLFDQINTMPSVTPQLSVPEVTALAEWTEKLTKASEDAYHKGYTDCLKAQADLKRLRMEEQELKSRLHSMDIEEAYNKGYADGVKSVNICPHCGEYIGEEE